MTHDDTPYWGLRCDMTPCFSARLVHAGNRLHYLADRATLTGTFTETQRCSLNRAFPGLLKQLEQLLTRGELNPLRAHRITLYHAGITCQADTLGSCGYLYIVMYPNATTTG
ncbi:antitoxin [Edwardsiella hoshinae]|uniref:Antitoxin n=1 Tax=Edwardsiella hoshinae TaxID=93378 RepID=A0ABM6EMQ2_9GAMM|nr:type IV toxin-antitoxin system YeeU family antitoxin [Edwardsiella hoshinae]AOV98215.1 antitoxin [Edwardsiella hoshinae]